MATDLATVSAKYQVVIPKRVREQFGLSPGQQLQVMALPGRIELVPSQPPAALRVFFCVGRTPSKESLTACGRFLDVLDAEASLVVPSISILEVFKWMLREHSEAQAIQAAAVMQRSLVVDLDSRLTHARSHFPACTQCTDWKMGQNLLHPAATHLHGAD